ncbi:hypothetical protein [Sphingomonas sp.]|uniref:hypothetical protein n=1 Tax=Sphingomonas sp. TaxID=28214 RepID=UPI0037526243
MGPAVIVARRAAIVSELSAAILDAADIVGVAQGDWLSALLVVIPDASAGIDETTIKAGFGDQQFIEQAEQQAGSVALATLASETLAAIRLAGVDGDLVSQGNGRWVNRPINTFTLKIQPKAGNIHFTLYGNPDSFDAGEFLRRDQNSYSRGWVRSKADVSILARLAKKSHSRRKR